MQYERDPKAVEGEVMQEIAEYKARLGPVYWRQYFNNFTAKLPSSSHGGDGYWAFLCKKIGTWEKPPIEVWGEEVLAGHSSLFINSSGKQFLGMIEECLLETGISPEHIRRLRDAEDEAWKLPLHLKPKDQAWHYHCAVIEATTPAFILLIARGFNRDPDLVG